MASSGFNALISKAKQRNSYWVGKAIHDFTEELHDLMQQRAVSKAELARRIDCSPAYVSKVLRGDSNLTIDSMVKLVRAVDGQLCIHVTRQEDEVRWFDIIGPSRAVKRRVPSGNDFEVVESHSFTNLDPLEMTAT